MKKGLIVSTSRVTAITPKLRTESEVLCFTDIDHGLKWIASNKDKVLNYHFAKIID